MKHKRALLFCVTSSTLFAGFNFNSCSGTGTFKQEILHYGGNYENAVTVGTIPLGIKGLKINLISDKDVDIRIYGENKDKIVHWPHGILHGPDLETKPYKNVNITYSGFYGTDGEKGHEYIEVNGTTPTILTMKAFGYKAGYATVNYSWTGKEGCTPSNFGTGTFKQAILKKATSLVGTIPPSVESVEINLTSEKDLDIQLYAQDGTAIARWKPAGLMAGATKQSLVYHDMNITWSGYNGVNNQKGHEFIAIDGNTTEMLIMKVYGYEAGVANVVYKWGDINNSMNITNKVFKTGQTSKYADFDDGYYKKGIDKSYSRDESKEIVTDNITKLQWQDSLAVGKIDKNWQGAKDYCKNLEFGGYSDWRLPTRKELAGLIDYSKIDSSMSDVFLYHRAYPYWTSTINAMYKYNHTAWMVDFFSGEQIVRGKSLKLYVGCVRAEE